MFRVPGRDAGVATFPAAATERAMRPCDPAVVVHYHEISLKRGNRPLFLRQPGRNLARATGDVGPVRVHQLPGRIVLDLEGHA